jgi:Protein of unknown function (DUF2637)
LLLAVRDERRGSGHQVVDAVAVLGVAAVAVVASYEHAYDLVRAHGESGWTAHMVLITGDGLIYASSMVMLDSARRKAPVPMLARWLLGLGIAATLAANVARGLGHGLMGAAVAAWPAVALVGAYELLMMVIRSLRHRRTEAPRKGTKQTRCRNGRPNCSPGSLRRTGSLDPCYSRSVPRWPATRPAPAEYLAVEVGGQGGKLAA